MAYDAIPGEALLGRHVQSAEELQAEMNELGLGHLPLAAYRQTPKQACCSAYAIINQVLSGLINFGINIGFGYALLKGKDYAGIWGNPGTPDAYGSYIYGDLLITSFLIIFISSCLSTGGIRDAMKKGIVIPVEDSLLRYGIWKFFPLRVRGTCSRSFLLAIEATVILVGITLAGLAITCAAGGLHGHRDSCAMPAFNYIYIKAFWAGLIASITYPLILLATINRATLPPLDYDVFVNNQRSKHALIREQEIHDGVGHVAPTHQLSGH